VQSGGETITPASQLVSGVVRRFRANSLLSSVSWTIDERIVSGAREGPLCVDSRGLVVVETAENVGNEETKRFTLGSMDNEQDNAEE
jgi:hypothetical protein